MSNSLSVSLAEDINSLAERRRALEELIAYAQQLSRASQGLDAVRHILKPSQLPKGLEKTFIHKLTSHLKELDDQELIKSLKLLDLHVRNDLQKILKIAGTKRDEFENELRASSEDDIKTYYTKLQEQLKEFRRKAQSNVAVRLELFDRGVQLEAADLGVTQAKMYDQLEMVKKQELQNKHLVTLEMKMYIKDIDKILNNVNYPDEIKQRFLDAKVDVAQSLEDIKNGKNIEDISCYIQPIALGEGFFDGTKYVGEDNNIPKKSPPISSEPAPNLTPAKIRENKNLDIEPQRETSAANIDAAAQPKFISGLKLFYRACKLWLITPMSVSWEEAKRRAQK